MSNTPQGVDWWLASDGNWYPPASHPNYTQAPAAPEPLLATTTGLSEDSPQNGTNSDIELGWRPFQQKVSAKHLTMIAVCVVYIVSPVDLLPEGILGPFGLPDDVLALVTAVGLYVRSRHLRSR